MSLDSLSLKMISCVIRFLVSENVCLDTKIKSLRCLEADIAKCEQNIVVILKIQDGRHRVFRKNVNITFHVQYVLNFPKMYSFANRQNI